MKDIDIQSFNVRGPGDSKKTNVILQYLKKFGANVCLLQEAHVAKDDLNTMFSCLQA